MSTTGYSYCAIHDMYFFNHNERDQHVQSSHDHPQCYICDRRFLNGNTLRSHWVIAQGHHYCRDCRKHFNTAEGLEFHIDQVHGADDSDDEDDRYDFYDIGKYEGWEDEQGLERYPNGVPPESQAHKRGFEDDNSWEAEDEVDFEDEEDLIDRPQTKYVTESEDEEDEEDEESLTHQFTCPICEKGQCTTVCTTRCGHLFCGPCIISGYKYTHECPICDEPGEVGELRRIYVSEQ